MPDEKNKPSTLEEKGLPHNVEAEKIVLGSALIGHLKPAALEAGLSPEDFTLENHRRICAAISTIHKRGEGVSSTTIYRELKGAVELSTLLSLSDDMPLIVDIDGFIRSVKNKSIRRKLIVACQHTMNTALISDDTPEAIDRAQKILSELSAATGPEIEFQTPIEIIEEAGGMERYAKRRSESGILSPWGEFNRITSGLHKGELILVAANTSKGKCHGPGTKILMYDGTMKAVESVRQGDLLMGPDSKPRKVLSVSAGNGPMFRIQPNKGTPFTCNDAHVLSLRRTRTWRKRNLTREGPGRAGETINIPLNEYLMKSPRFKHLYKLWHAPAIHFQDTRQPLLLDPYFLGVLLGDGNMGTNTKVGVTTMDKEIVECVQDQADLYGLKVRVEPQNNASSTYYISRGPWKPGDGWGRGRNPILNRLQSMELTVSCEKKFVPREYLTASLEARLALLAGLMDTDGSPNCGRYDFCVKSQRLIEAVEFLARSVGLQARRKKPRVVKGETYHRTGIHGDCSIIPVRIRRKVPHRGVVLKREIHGFKVHALGCGEYYGFELDKDGLYLLEDFTVTHNTAFCLNYAHHASTKGTGAALYSIEMHKEEVNDRLICISGHIDSQKIRRPEPGDAGVVLSAVASLGNLPIYICDRSTITLASIEGSLRRAIQKHGIGLAVIDYLNLITSSGRSENRVQEVSKLSRGLKVLAGDLKIPIIAICQFNRSPSKEDRYPELSDLRESGSLEQDANTVIFLHSEQKYSSGYAEQWIPTDVIIAKQRNGRANLKIPFLFCPAWGVFAETERNEENAEQQSHEDHGGHRKRKKGKKAAAPPAEAPEPIAF